MQVLTWMPFLLFVWRVPVEPIVSNVLKFAIFCHKLRTPCTAMMSKKTFMLWSLTWVYLYLTKYLALKSMCWKDTNHEWRSSKNQSLLLCYAHARIGWENLPWGFGKNNSNILNIPKIHSLADLFCALILRFHFPKKISFLFTA